MLAISLFSCKKELEKANINPNNPENIDPEYLLNSSIYSTIKLFGGDMRARVFSHYSNYVNVGNSQLPRYYTYTSSVTGYWQSAYISCLQPLHQISLNYSANPAYKNRVLLAKIFESYIYSNMVAIWGSIPKTHALTGQVYIAYDKEEDIYNDLLKELKEAANSINMSGDTYIDKSDAVFAGDLLKWKKFANTLRLRLAIRIANANPAEAKKVATEVLSDEENTIKSANETARAFFGLTSDTWSFLYNENVVKAIANASSLNVISESLVQYMQPYNDPRLEIYAKPANKGPHKDEYWGKPKTSNTPKGVSLNPNPHSSLSPADYSPIGDYFMKPNEEFVFLSYEESCFLKAEAALKGWSNSLTAEQYYVEGVNASMKKFNVPQSKINTYLATPGIKWNTVVDTSGRGSEFSDFLGITTSAILKKDPFHQIVMQEWLAGFYQAMDAWTLIRRTQVLDFPPHFNPDGNEGGVVGYANIPQRLNYPGIEYQVNVQELNKALPYLNGSDNLRTKLWFALPTKQNPFLPSWE